jgi:hypothetical protein
MRRIKDQVSPGLVVGMIALFVALGGTAYAIGRNTVGTPQLKNDAVTSAKLRDGAVTPDKLRDYRRVGIERVRATAGPDAEAARIAAPRVRLFRVAPFTIYGKCFSDPGNTFARIYIATSQPGAIFQGDSGNMSGNPFLSPATPERDRELNGTSAGSNAADFYGMHSTEVAAMSRSGTAFEARIPFAVKRGTLPGGNGIYGSGNVCLFAGELSVFAR